MRHWDEVWEQSLSAAPKPDAEDFGKNLHMLSFKMQSSSKRQTGHSGSLNKMDSNKRITECQSLVQPLAPSSLIWDETTLLKVLLNYYNLQGWRLHSLGSMFHCLTFLMKKRHVLYLYTNVCQWGSIS